MKNDQRAHTLFLQLSTSQQINPPMTHIVPSVVIIKYRLLLIADKA